MFSLAKAVSDLGNFLLKGKLGLAIALRLQGVIKAVIEFGHAALKIAELGIVAGRLLALLEALGDVDEALVHVGQRPHIRALGHAG